ncbi:hypothetical protein D3C78_1423500 [compost metagenome]
MHSFEVEDLKLYFKTAMPEEQLFKLIKIWQMKLSDVVQEYDWGTEEMMELLELFGCKRISETDGFRTYREANLYLIWEYANTWWSEEEQQKPEFNHPEANRIFEKVIQQNREHHSEYWQEWEEERKQEIEEERKLGKR